MAAARAAGADAAADGDGRDGRCWLEVDGWVVRRGGGSGRRKRRGVPAIGSAVVSASSSSSELSE